MDGLHEMRWRLTEAIISHWLGAVERKKAAAKVTRYGIDDVAKHVRQKALWPHGVARGKYHDQIQHISHGTYQRKAAETAAYRTSIAECPLPVQCITPDKTYGITQHVGYQVTQLPVMPGHINHAHANHRSEERRVGKECRSRWSPY